MNLEAVGSYQNDRGSIKKTTKTSDQSRRRNILRSLHKIATEETYMYQERNRQNISISQKKITTDKTYMDQDRERQNITGSRNKIAIDATYLARN